MKVSNAILSLMAVTPSVVGSSLHPNLTDVEQVKWNAINIPWAYETDEHSDQYGNVLGQYTCDEESIKCIEDAIDHCDGWYTCALDADTRTFSLRYAGVPKQSQFLSVPYTHNPESSQDHMPFGISPTLVARAVYAFQAYLQQPGVVLRIMQCTDAKWLLQPMYIGE